MPSLLRGLENTGEATANDCCEVVCKCRLGCLPRDGIALPEKEF